MVDCMRNSARAPPGNKGLSFPRLHGEVMVKVDKTFGRAERMIVQIVVSFC